MAKRSSVNKNKYRQEIANRDQAKRKTLKAIIMNRKIPISDRFRASIKLAELPRNGSQTRVRLRCEVTGRSRSNYRKFQVCRIVLRDLANSGQLPGVIKSSW